MGRDRMTIEQGVGKAVVKIRTSPYSLIQPFAMLGLFIVLGVFTPIGGDNPLDQALNLSLSCMWGLVVAVSLWGLTWGVDLTPESCERSLDSQAEHSLAGSAGGAPPANRLAHRWCGSFWRTA